jgi:hypothetical protein
MVAHPDLGGPELLLRDGVHRGGKQEHAGQNPEDETAVEANGCSGTSQSTLPGFELTVA